MSSPARLQFQLLKLSCETLFSGNAKLTPPQGTLPCSLYCPLSSDVRHPNTCVFPLVAGSVETQWGRAGALPLSSRPVKYTGTEAVVTKTFLGLRTSGLGVVGEVPRGCPDWGVPCLLPSWPWHSAGSPGRGSVLKSVRLSGSVSCSIIPAKVCPGVDDSRPKSPVSSSFIL